MQSVASLMSIGRTDVGNLEDLVEDEENETLDINNKFLQVSAKLSQLEAGSKGQNDLCEYLKQKFFLIFKKKIFKNYIVFYLKILKILFF